MQLLQWPVSIGALVAAAIATVWLGVGEEIAPSATADSPESAVAPTVTPVRNRIYRPVEFSPSPNPLAVQPAEPPTGPESTTDAAGSRTSTTAVRRTQAAAIREAAKSFHDPVLAPDDDSHPAQAGPFAPEQKPTTWASLPAVNPPLPPRDLQTRMDEPRHHLLGQRAPHFDTYSGPSPHIPPWFAPYNAAQKRYRDARRIRYLRQREFRRQRRSSWMDAICPLPKPRRDWSTPHNDQRRIEWPDKRFYRDAFIYRPPHGSAGLRDLR